jgi:hypothetical protein
LGEWVSDECDEERRRGGSKGVGKRITGSWGYREQRDLKREGDRKKRKERKAETNESRRRKRRF